MDKPNDSERGDFQQGVATWMQECFGPEISADPHERNVRFMEESLELVQSLGLERDHALAMVDYVYGRPPGDPPQEVVGVRVTLSALCDAHGMSEDECAQTELPRIWQKVAQIRDKNRSKPAIGNCLAVYPERVPPTHTSTLPAGLDLGLIQAVLDDYERLVTHGEVDQAGRYSPTDVGEQSHIIADWLSKETA